MNHAPRVSIVIPVFNDEDTVAAAIQSCENQTLAEIEIICVDDASSDHTGAIVEEIAARDHRVRYIRQEQNQSAFQARRVGILAARSDYVLFLDGDDELLPDAAASSLLLAQRDDADLVGFGVEVVGNSGGVVGGYQTRLAPKHKSLSGQKVLGGLFPIGKPAQGQLWRYLFRARLLREAYNLLPEDLILPRVNDLPLLYLVAALADSYVSTPERLYRYFYGRGGSGQSVDAIEQVEFYAEAIRSIDIIAPAVHVIARDVPDAGQLLDSYDSVRMSIAAYVCWYLISHSRPDLHPTIFDHIRTLISDVDLIIAVARFYPQALAALKLNSSPVVLGERPVSRVMLTTRKLTTGGVSGVLLTQANLLMSAGYDVTIVARRYGSDPGAVPAGATFIEMVGQGLPDRLAEWAKICQVHAFDVIIDHQVLYSRDWPEYALIARALGVATIGWLHNFAGRPTLDRNGLHTLLTENAPMLETVVTLSPLDVAFWKLRGVEHAVYVPNPPSPMLLESISDSPPPKARHDGRIELVWWGRLEERTKQVSHLLDVATELRALGADFYLTVIGPNWRDSTAARFNSLAHKRRLGGYVSAIGERRGRELVDAIDRADAFVSTSVIEGYQLTIAEAQARGLPVLMYELPWLTLVQDNEGVVAVPQGQPGELARQIVALFEDSDRYEYVSKGAIDAAERALSYDFAGLYEQVITGRLPERFSPDPTFDDARLLLNLIIFYGEQEPESSSIERPPSKRRSGRRSTAIVGAPSGAFIGYRVWRAATPLGRVFLQIAPGMRPTVHRLKRALVRR